MIENIIKLLLSSSVLAALVTVIFKGNRDSKNNNIDYVNTEKSKWRDAVRTIALALPSARDEELISLLESIPVYLNPYGQYSENNKLEDKHIWDILDNIDNLLKSTSEEKELLIRHRISELREYLLLLLKYDWERSKQEVKKDFAWRGAVITGAGVICLVLGMQLFFLPRVDLYLLFGLIGFLLFPIVLGMISIEGETGLKEWVIRIIVIFLMLLYVGLYLSQFIINENIQVKDMGVWIYLLVAFATMVGLFFGIAVSNNIRKKYTTEVALVKNRYQEKDKTEAELKRKNIYKETVDLLKDLDGEKLKAVHSLISEFSDGKENKSGSNPID